MQEIRCPNCGKVFQVDESGYAQIVQQVRDREFEKEILRRKEELAQKTESDLALVRMEQERARNEALAGLNSTIAEKEREIDKLKAQLAQAATEKKLAVTEATQAKERELMEKETEITVLKGQISGKDTENRLKEKSLREQYESTLRLKDEQIEYYRDFKARQSTKMIGESLEQHCLDQFNAIRMTAFPTAYFEKDNDARSGSKGDFIFRESAPDGTEFISIMFEMKNEMDETATKHKNEDFFRKLDQDRNEKKCEYAVLVSLLEPESELYNTGIVDVSYRYPKMFVIRPQFFKSLIMLLVNAAKNTVGYKKELALALSQNVDVTNFENKLIDFRNKFGDHYTRASGKFKDAIDQIDATIKKLEGIKKSFEQSENYLRLANQDTEELTIRKLTYKNPTMKVKFDEARRKAAEDGTDVQES